MAKRTDIKKILIIGSGPIVIGQAAEFDYAGTQACLALKEEGYEVVLCNSNPATIMTDTSIADKVYMEPLTLEYIAKILRYERPDAIVPGIGGQTGLNLAMQLEKKGVLKECGVELLGTSSESIERAEDRELFKEMCQSIGEPTIPSEITYNLDEAKAAAEKIGYPVVLRPAFTLGGTGGGFANDENELIEIGRNAFALSPVHQVLIEKSVKGYKEIEFEVMRDSNDHAITICGMENVDPVGVHTGDSIVVAPILSLSDHDLKMLNDSAIRIIRELKIEGGCNVQFALNPHSSEYYLIEVNPRVSRSSALASKASGYPIARVTAKIAVGMSLEDIPVAGGTAAIEPSLDYIVAKFPRFPFDKFTDAPNTLGTQMKATGEVMAIGSNLCECFLKASRSLEAGVKHLYVSKFDDMSAEELFEYISEFRSDNLFAIAELYSRGGTTEKIHEVTQITELFLDCLKEMIDMENDLSAKPWDTDALLAAKKMGFSDAYVARLWKTDEISVYNRRRELGMTPSFRMVDTLHTGKYIPYLYSSYTGADVWDDGNKVFTFEDNEENRAGMVAVLEFMKEVTDSGATQANPAESSPYDIRPLFRDGGCGMYLDGVWAVKEFSEELNKGDDETAFHTALFPAGPAGSHPILGCDGWAIPSVVQDADQSWDLVEHIMSSDNQTRHATLWGLLPFLNSENGKEEFSAAFWGPLMEQVATVSSRPKDKNVALIEQTLADATQAVCLGQMTAEDAVDYMIDTVHASYVD